MDRAQWWCYEVQSPKNTCFVGFQTRAMTKLFITFPRPVYVYTKMRFHSRDFVISIHVTFVRVTLAYEYHDNILYRDNVLINSNDGHSIISFRQNCRELKSLLYFDATSILV